MFVYAYDELTDHMEWLQADCTDAFFWQRVYKGIIRPPDNIYTDAPTLTGLQLNDDEILVDVSFNEGTMRRDEDEEEEEEEEEEDPEEEPEEENPEKEGRSTEGQILRDYNIPCEDATTNLPIVDRRTTEDELDSSVWRNVYEPSDYSAGRRSFIPTPSSPPTTTRERSLINELLAFSLTNLASTTDDPSFYLYENFEEFIADFPNYAKEYARKRRMIVSEYL